MVATPSISVIIPNLDMGGFLPDAVASVMRQAEQVDEILIVDAGSSDDSLQVIEELRAKHPQIRQLSSVERNPSAVRNCGLDEAKGEITAFIDADDLWPEDKLTKQLQRLADEPRVDVVSGFVQYFDRQDQAQLKPAADSRTETLFHVHLGASLFRRSVFERIGGFDPTLRYSEDVDVLLRLREIDIPMTILRARTLYYRRHEASLMSRTDPAKERDFRRVLANSMLRRRRAGAGPLGSFESLIEPAEKSEDDGA